jgi:hypothetical protein
MKEMGVHEEALANGASKTKKAPNSKTLARNTEPAKSSSFDSVLIISVVYSHN